MTASRPGLLLLAGAVLLLGCATRATPGDPGYPHNVSGTYAGRVTLDGAEYEAVVRMRTARDGTVSGVLAAAPLDVPAGEASGSMEGDFSGTVHGRSLVWRSAWVVPSTGCSGVLLGRGPVASGGGAVEGEVRLVGSCEASAGGTYRLSRQRGGGSAGS